MKYIKAIILLFLSGITLTVSAQKLKIVSGDVASLSGQTSLNLKMDYSEMKFYKENIDEQTYLDRRQKEISANKGEEESKLWLDDWNYSKTVSFPKKFIDSWSKNSKIVLKEDGDFPYTLVVKTVWIYPGWFAAVMNQPAKLTTALKIVETANPSQVVLEIKSTKAPGDVSFVGVPNNNDRMAEGYAKTAKTVAKMISKKL
ncbi:hypothetical protein PQ465_11075 [Sphingobacterium oryzagri]|uniref:Uncharacterized protein n=1 Tax=Sphingobacterium oryzagri TaxID=3025669 RepID=A0ABY7WB11_9SPHI|nr:hypothetical protein [Sphingobacterium sp. KACC 22765]WDF66847.1 hypothetical protein PQ465_11075 [Sphingobacterium sp. KACC 22765]